MIVAIAFGLAAFGQLADLITFQMFYGSSHLMADPAFTNYRVELNPFAAGMVVALGQWWVLPFKLALGAILFALAARLKTPRRRTAVLVWIGAVGFIGAAGNAGVLWLSG